MGYLRMALDYYLSWHCVTHIHNVEKSFASMISTTVHTPQNYVHTCIQQIYNIPGRKREVGRAITISVTSGLLIPRFLPSCCSAWRVFSLKEYKFLINVLYALLHSNVQITQVQKHWNITEVSHAEYDETKGDSGKGHMLVFYIINRKQKLYFHEWQS